MSTLLVLGTLPAKWQRTVATAATAAGLEPAAAEDEADLARFSDIGAIILGDEAPDSGLTTRTLQRAEVLRRNERLERVAIFAPAGPRAPADYVAALTAGIDDLLTVPSDAVGTTLRLRAAREAAAGHPPSLRRGLAWTLGPRGVRSAARARVLRAAGFRALEGPDAALSPWQDEPRLALAVWETGDPELALGEVRRARAAGSLCRFVLCVPDERATELALECEQLDGVRALPQTAPPDSVVFLVNQMAESAVFNQRKARRKLASMLVTFRSQDRADLGLSYNVSEGGLYVRTLAPHHSGKVDLSIEVGDGQLAQVVGEVAWSRALSHDGSATAPPGFGVKIVEASAEARATLAARGAG